MVPDAGFGVRARKVPELAARSGYVAQLPINGGWQARGIVQDESRDIFVVVPEAS